MPDVEVSAYLVPSLVRARIEPLTRNRMQPEGQRLALAYLIRAPPSFHDNRWISEHTSIQRGILMQTIATGEDEELAPR